MMYLLKNLLTYSYVFLMSLSHASGPLSQQKMVTPFESVTCASIMGLLGKAAQFSQIESNQTRNAIGSMMDFRWQTLSPKDNELRDSNNITTNSTEASSQDKTQMAMEILRIGKLYREGVLEQNESPDSSVVLSGLHLSGPEVTDFLKELAESNNKIQALSWAARQELLQQWYFGRGLKHILTKSLPLAAVPLLVGLTPLANTNIHELAKFVGLYGLMQTGTWILNPAVLFPVMWGGSLDFKFKKRYATLDSLLRNSKEGTWAFQSTTYAVHKSFKTYWVSPDAHEVPLFNQAATEAAPSRYVDDTMDIDVLQLLTFKKDANSQATFPVFDIIIHFAKESPPAPAKSESRATNKNRVLVPISVEGSQ